MYFSLYRESMDHQCFVMTKTIIDLFVDVSRKSCENNYISSPVLIRKKVLDKFSIHLCESLKKRYAVLGLYKI